MILIKQYNTSHGIFKTAHPQTETEFQNYFDLRYRILRQPWNQPRGTERDVNENERHHFILVNHKDEIAGVCCLQKNSETEMQLRYMAIDNAYSGKQLGNYLMMAAEEKAIALSMKTVFLQARENAVNFYKRNGYHIIEKTFLLFDSIQHFSMVKKL
ncbi:MAG: GNAT family N-acetyltransferase [Bacteroidetes bacterium]|nr:GNAT family N-acetyltransferase [Bacteroidota bacterium]